MSLSVLVSTPDRNSAVAQRCLDTLADSTRGERYTLYIADNREATGWKHEAEIRRMYRAVGPPFITLDDDTWFEQNGWLDYMMAARFHGMSPNVIGAEIWRDTDTLWSTGMWVDGKGRPHNNKTPHDTTQTVAACCSCCWLLAGDLPECRAPYSKYYFDMDIAYQSHVVVTPVRVFHQANRNMAEKKMLLEHDRRLFLQAWTPAELERKKATQ